MGNYLFFFDAVEPLYLWYADPQTWAAVGTTLAFLATSWSAFEARKMAKIAVLQHEVTSRTYLTFGEMNWNIERPHLLDVEIKNVGNVPAVCHLEELSGDIPSERQEIVPYYLFQNETTRIGIRVIRAPNAEFSTFSISIRYSPLGKKYPFYMRTSTVKVHWLKNRFITTESDFAD